MNPNAETALYLFVGLPFGFAVLYVWYYWMLAPLMDWIERKWNK